MGVVDGFEMIDVADRDRKGRLRLLRLGEGQLQPQVERAAVGQAGQGIAVGGARRLGELAAQRLDLLARPAQLLVSACGALVHGAGERYQLRHYRERRTGRGEIVGAAVERGGIAFGVARGIAQRRCGLVHPRSGLTRDRNQIVHRNIAAVHRDHVGGGGGCQGPVPRDRRLDAGANLGVRSADIATAQIIMGRGRRQRVDKQQAANVVIQLAPLIALVGHSAHATCPPPRTRRQGADSGRARAHQAAGLTGRCRGNIDEMSRRGLNGESAAAG